ncbi:Fungalysin metallopeptidase-domain-containing protein [Chytridium lagenaria]|nr:Fungalysin metallopeptidase-domain-containing protein [Chytridium lagenaria]
MLAIAALIAIAAIVRAAPAPAAAPASLPSLHVPESVFTAVYEPSFAPGASAVDNAKMFVAGKTNGDISKLAVTSSIGSTNGIQHVHMVETYQGVPIVNLVSNVNIDTDGTIISAGHAASSTANLVAPSSLRTLSAPEAVVAAAKALGYSTTGLTKSLKFAGGKVTGAPFAMQDIFASEKYYLTPSGQLESVWDLEIRHREDAWNNLFVSASSGAILGATNWVHDFGGSPSTTTVVPPPTSTVAPPVTTVVPPVTTVVPPPPTTTVVPPESPVAVYNVVPFNKENILNGQVLISDPADKTASPSGWLNPAVNGEFKSVGNNANSRQANKVATSRNGGKFDYVYDTTKDPASSIPAAIAQVHYITNYYHDLMYKYGFNEASANFQTNNFGKGGKGNDAINANIQAAGTNNANFATPPDGQAGTMNMYVFDLTTPKRDGDEDNVSFNTSSPTVSPTVSLVELVMPTVCLVASLVVWGEGWSDVVAWWATMDGSMTRASDRATGAYVVNKSVGIRTYPYSTSTTTNKHMYSTLKTVTEVHGVGEVWSTMLYEAYWNMVDIAGFEADITNVSSSAGNIRFLQNLVDGMKLQPCNPTFITARDAIIQADQKNTGGKFKCAIWKGFAKRGLGFGATSTKANVFALPADC